MKRNWDTIREVLIRLEEVTPEERALRLSNFPSERSAEISYQGSTWGQVLFFARTKSVEAKCKKQDLTPDSHPFGTLFAALSEVHIGITHMKTKLTAHS